MSSHDIQRYMLLSILFISVGTVCGSIAYLYLLIPIFIAVVIGLLTGCMAVYSIIELVESK
jgi:hypothetical protein